MYILDFTFIAVGRIESIVVDRKAGELQLHKTNVICLKSCERYPLADISEIKAYKKGHNGVNVYTIHYRIEIEFLNHPNFKLSETGSE